MTNSTSDKIARCAMRGFLKTLFYVGDKTLAAGDAIKTLGQSAKDEYRVQRARRNGSQATPETNGDHNLNKPHMGMLDNWAWLEDGSHRMTGYNPVDESGAGQWICTSQVVRTYKIENQPFIETLNSTYALGVKRP